MSWVARIMATLSLCGALLAACAGHSEPSPKPTSGVDTGGVRSVLEREPPSPVSSSKKKGLPRKDALDENTRSRATAAVTRKMRELAGLSDEHSFLVTEAGRSCLKGWKLRFGHFYRAFGVMDSRVEVCFAEDDRLEIVTDQVHRKVVVDTKPRLTAEQAFTAHNPPGSNRRQTGESGLVIWSEYIDPPPPSEEELKRGSVEQKLEIRHRLVYRFETGGLDGMTDYVEFIDAHTGEKVGQISTMDD